ncbi:LysR family transcriptional regulator [Marinobacterium sedimentorum]|uniref:LysR family transcriptional regulator n=1 Tax=Marinobacterium sedimentorum TaxID=2927804 RepID=UPI0020C64EE8|nr:LysR family transcriptional regulator [Marinobacterium sedimentorum]MCP8686441.1 LysR family transcriptional regulator [Marinobacterium sedimentorum]
MTSHISGGSFSFGGMLGGSLEDIKAFCAVIEFGSVSRAALEMGETKGSISRRVSRLEARLGAALLARTPRAVSATEEGIAFYAKARDALSLLADATQGARQSRTVPHGNLRVTAPMDIGLDVLPPLLVRFRALHPQITVELLLTDAPLDLAANRIDLALRATSGNLPDMGYRASALTAFRMGLYGAPIYLAARGIPEVPQDLQTQDLVTFRELAGAASLSLVNARGRRVEVTARPVARTTDYASVHRIIQAGGGIGVLPDLIAGASLAAGLIVPVLPDWSLSEGKLYAISLSGDQAPARVSVFRDFIRTELNAPG